MLELPAHERIVLAVDTSSAQQAEHLAEVARDSGARFIKLGLEIMTATSLDYCSDLAGRHGLDWIADAKLDDIPNTVSKAVANMTDKEYPPFGITMHVKAGREAMQKAQETAGSVIMFGVTELTSIPPQETIERYSQARPDFVYLLGFEAALAGLKGVVASPMEVGLIKSDHNTEKLVTLIPGTRSVGAKTHDQANVTTPEKAIQDGADLLVIGRQITEADDPSAAYSQVV